MTEPVSRAERKQQTRQAILGAALVLSSQAPLSAISIRQVARVAGIQAPSFYVHFDSMDSVGLALVEESFESINAVLLGIRREVARGRDMIEPSIAALTDQASGNRQHFEFMVRERYSGSPAVREAIRRHITQAESDFALDLARFLPAEWPNEDIRLAAKVIVMTIVSTFADLILGDFATTEEFVDQTLALIYLQLRGALRPRSGTAGDGYPWQ